MLNVYFSTMQTFKSECACCDGRHVIEPQVSQSVDFSTFFIHVSTLRPSLPCFIMLKGMKL